MPPPRASGAGPIAVRILDISQQVTALHVAPAFSCIEITDLIYNSLMRREANGDYRDVFLMSKGHGCMIQYVILEEQGVLSRQDIDNYCKPNGRLGAHPDYETPGIAASTGSLGHGLGMATGQAYAEKLKNTDVLIYCVLSDGEFQEGSTWEAMMMAANLKLDNLIAFMDFNDFGGLEHMSDGHPAFYPLVEKAESFGWEAVEVDGHDEEAMREAVMSRRGGRPMLVVCRTVKGKGVSYMENVADLALSVAEQGRISTGPQGTGGSAAMRNRFADTFYELGKADPRLCVVVADISPAGSIAKFRSEFPRRFVNTGVSEQIMIGMTAGMAQRGLKPFAYTIATFTLYRPFEMVRDDLCYQNLPVTIVGIGGGVTYSTLGATHHAQEDVAIASAIPNLSVIAPCDPSETEAATRWCAAQEQGPVYLRLGKAGEPDLSKDAPDAWAFGKLRRLRAGRDVCILSYGPIMKRAFAVAERFEAAGKSVAIASVHTLKPLDRKTLSEILQTFAHVVVIEECAPNGSLAMRVKELAWDAGAACRIDTFTLKDAFIHCYGSHDDILNAHGLGVPEMAARLGLQ